MPFRKVRGKVKGKVKGKMEVSPGKLGRKEAPRDALQWADASSAKVSIGSTNVPTIPSRRNRKVRSSRDVVAKRSGSVLFSRSLTQRGHPIAPLARYPFRTRAWGVGVMTTS